MAIAALPPRLVLSARGNGSTWFYERIAASAE
jgi:hypothetical protein